MDLDGKKTRIGENIRKHPPQVEAKISPEKKVRYMYVIRTMDDYQEFHPYTPMTPKLPLDMVSFKPN